MKENKTLNFIGNGSCFNTDFGNNSAFYIDKEKQSLSKLFNEREKNKITCMHLDDEITKRKAECLGFDIAELIKT